MAKLTGPLLSITAAGKLGETLVYFTWKGLNVVRRYVVPSNPKSAAQTTQRGYVKSAVEDIHLAQADETHPLVAVDASAYAQWSNTEANPRTWFNQALMNWVKQKVAAKFGTVFRGGSVTPGATQLTIVLYADEIALTKITAGNFYYGTSPTALLNSMAATIDTTLHSATKAITGLVSKTKYYIQFRPTAEATYVGIRSGIYIGTVP